MVTVLRVEEYLVPETVEEASAMLSERGGAARPLAGGTDLVPDLRSGRISVTALVDIARLPLRYIEERDGQACIGSLVTHRQLERSEFARRRLGVLHEACSTIGGVQTRTLGTVGGNLVTGLPSADTAPPLLVLDAQLRLVSAAGERWVKCEEFFLGPRNTSRRPDELLTEIRLEVPEGPVGGHFIKFGKRNAMALSVLSVAVLVQLMPDLETIDWARIAMGTAAPTPVRLPETEKALRGASFSPEVAVAAGETASREIRPRSSARASEWYRRELARTLVKRALHEAYSRARSAGQGGEE